MARELIGAGNFVEVHVSTSLEVCEQRDVKGLYKKARSGQLPNMSGISSPYEPPLAPHVALSSSESNIEESVDYLQRAMNGNE
jgi:bifunctional enzyme CysN/CysC